MTYDDGYVSAISRPPFQASYPSQPPADPPNFIASYAGAGAGGGGDEEPSDDDDPSERGRPEGRQGPGFPSGSHGPSGGPSGGPYRSGGRGPGGPGGGGPGGPGGGGYGHGGAGGGFPGGGNPSARTAPYGNYPPTIKTDLKLSDLPKWDGDFDTAITYFHKISELAAMGGDLPVALGFWLGQTLEPNSPAEEWYMTLPPKWKNYMRGHYLNYIDTIKHYFLGRPWQQRMQYEFEAQRFRQAGHEGETPHHYFVRRIRFVRMFLQVAPDSQDEVYHITMDMPMGWNQHLTPTTVRDTTTLQLRAREMHDALINTAVSTADNLVTYDNIVSVLQKAGYLKSGSNSNYGKGNSASGSTYRRYQPRTQTVTAHAAEGSAEEGEEEEGLHRDPAITHQAFAVMRKTEPPPSRRGPFPFDKQDQVHTSVGRLPAWPC